MKKSTALHILGLSDGASDDDIKKAHRKLIIENHPDKFGTDETARKEAEEKTKQINEARDVLLSRKWDPEYATAGTPYGAPYSYRPQSGSPAGQGYDPFAGWPFAGGTTYYWTWDSSTGTTKTNAPDGANPFDGFPFGANPFVGGFPFDDSFTTSQTQQSAQGGSAGPHSAGSRPTGPQPFSANPFDILNDFLNPRTLEEKIDDAKKDLKRDIQLILIKLFILAVALLVSMPAVGLYLYTIVSIGQGIYKRLGMLTSIFVVPLIMLAIIFLPAANAAVGVFGLIFFVLAALFDIRNVYRHIISIRELKAAIDTKK